MLTKNISYRTKAWSLSLRKSYISEIIMKRNHNNKKDIKDTSAKYRPTFIEKNQDKLNYLLGDFQISHSVNTQLKCWKYLGKTVSMWNLYVSMWCFHLWVRDQNKAAYLEESHMTWQCWCLWFLHNHSCHQLPVFSNPRYFKTKTSIIQPADLFLNKVINMYAGFFTHMINTSPPYKNPLKPVIQVLHIDKSCLWSHYTWLDICGSWMSPDSCLPMKTGVYYQGFVYRFFKTLQLSPAKLLF